MLPTSAYSDVVEIKNEKKLFSFEKRTPLFDEAFVTSSILTIKPDEGGIKWEKIRLRE